jgi:NADH dehydrogenase
MPDPVGFTDFLRAISKGRLHRFTWFLPFPAALLRSLLELGRAFRSAPIAPDRFLSLRSLSPMATAEDLARLGLQLRPLLSGMHRSGSHRRRQLLLEARALLGYVSRSAAPPRLCKRYARAVEHCRHGRVLELPPFMMCWPGALALLDRHRAPSPELRWRIAAATAIAESSRTGAVRFLRTDEPAMPARIATVLWALAAEALVRVLRLPLGFWLRRAHARMEAATR